MPSADEYRALAAQCFALAQNATDPSDKNRLIQMAQAWRDLADRVALSEKPDSDTGSK